MSAARKASTKKTAAKKSTAKKAAARKVVKKAAPRKATAKKTVAQKTTAKKTAAKKTAEKKAAGKEPKATGKKKKAGGKTAPEASENPVSKAIADRAAHKQPSGESRTAARKGSAPIAFSIDDVRDLLATRKTTTTRSGNGSKSAQPAAKAPAKVAKKAAPTPEEPASPAPKQVLGAASLDDILGISGGGNNRSRKPEDVPAKWRKYYDLLIELRRHVKDELDQHTKDTLKRSAKDDSGDLSNYGQHMADVGTESFDRDFALSLVSSEQEALKEINAAIDRIFEGTYGTCEITGEPIAAERLEAVPFARFSVAGQAEYERTNRKRVQRGGVFADASVEAANFGDDDSDD